MLRARVLGLTSLVAVALAVAVTACGGQEDLSPTADTVAGTLAVPEEAQLPPGDAAAGKEIFASAGCGGCHVLADAGSAGNVGPDLDQSQPDYELAVSRVTNGAGVMPAFGGTLSEQQIADVVTYVVEATGGTVPEGAAAGGETAAATGATATTEAATTEAATTEAATTEAVAAGGDPAAGREIFLSAGCGSCHTFADAGSTGNVGPNLDEASPSFDKAVERVTDGAPPMPSFADILSEQQIQDVAAYVSGESGG
jgi:mono/diheme cytochrome c family protein